MINSKIPHTAASVRHGHTVLGQALSGRSLTYNTYCTPYLSTYIRTCLKHHPPFPEIHNVYSISHRIIIICIEWGLFWKIYQLTTPRGVSRHVHPKVTYFPEGLLLRRFEMKHFWWGDTRYVSSHICSFISHARRWVYRWCRNGATQVGTFLAYTSPICDIPTHGIRYTSARIGRVKIR